VNGLGRGCKGQHAFYKLDLGILTLFLFLLFLVMFLRGIKRLSGSIVSRDIASLQLTSPPSSMYSSSSISAPTRTAVSFC
jgi:Na+-transporting methylmalonyl-CoA/oxaloacetate decarboxylase gamma subunit